MPDDRPRILTITGPTASGKTAFSLALAEHRPIEIVSVDSRQLYEELTIGTAKPTPKELQRVPHHFVGDRSLARPLSAGAFAAEATERITQIVERAHVPVLVGGSTLYLQAVQEGLADIPPVPSETRALLTERLRAEGADALFNELCEVDPVASVSMDATKTQRVVRALEVYYGTGQPLSSYFERSTPPPYRFSTVLVDIDRSTLYERINNRVDRMLDAGLLDEVRKLLASGVDPDVPVMRTIGYRETVRFLKGAISSEEMERLIKRNTRRYAKRQLTWFRRWPDYSWVAPERVHEACLSFLAESW